MARLGDERRCRCAPLRSPPWTRIETAPPRTARLDAVGGDAYLGGIGPGAWGLVWDLPSPRIPKVEVMITLLTARAGIAPEIALEIAR
jgi:hypothetical protein